MGEVECEDSKPSLLARMKGPREVFESGIKGTGEKPVLVPVMDADAW